MRMVRACPGSGLAGATRRLLPPCAAPEFDQDEDGAGHPAAAAVSKPQAKASAAAVPSARSDSATLVPKRAPYQVAGKVDVAPAKKHFIAPTTNAERSLRTLRAVRRAAVLKAVQLHPVSFTLYDAAPQTLYELLRREIKLRSKRSQARDDDAVVGTQTEDVEEDEQACQAPDDLAAQAKRALTDASASGRTAAALTANKARLSRFLTSASAVVEALCAENALASAGGAGGFGPKSELPLATRSARLALLDPFSGRSPLDVSFSRDASETLVAYGLDGSAAPQGKKKEDQALRRACQGGGLLAVWVMHQPSVPWHVLRALGLPTCCALATVPCRVAVAGTADGSVQIWDLREPATRHERVRVGGSRMALRSPTFCSDGGGVGRGHLAPVVALSLSEPQAAAETADLIISSLDGAGRLVVWQVMEGDLSLLSVDESADADAGGFGYGQAVGGRLRLVQTSVVQTCGPALSLAPAKGARGVASGRGGGAGDEGLPERALCLAALPSDPSKFLVGTDGGRLLQVSRCAAHTRRTRTARPLSPLPLPRRRRPRRLLSRRHPRR